MKDFFNSSYDLERFRFFLHETLKVETNTHSTQEKLDGELSILSYIQVAQSKTFDDSKELGFYAFKVKSIRAKITLHTEIKKIFSRKTFYDAILAVFYEEDNLDQFRLSLITFGFDDQKNKKVITNIRRQSFMLGVGEKTKTVLANFKNLAKEWEKSPSLETLTKVFAIEPVTDEFFKQYRDIYDEKVSLLGDNQEIVSIFSKISKENVQKSISTFIKKLLGRIVFLYFIQKKGWLGVPKGEKWGKGDKSFIQNLFKKYGDNFYQEALVPLFFDSLNRDRGQEAFSKAFGVRIPFLNGGLFEESRSIEILYLIKFSIKTFSKIFLNFLINIILLLMNLPLQILKWELTQKC